MVSGIVAGETLRGRVPVVVDEGRLRIEYVPLGQLQRWGQPFKREEEVRAFLESSAEVRRLTASREFKRGQSVAVDGVRPRTGLIIQGGVGPHLPVAVMGPQATPRVNWLPVHVLESAAVPIDAEARLRKFLESVEAQAAATSAKRQSPHHLKGRAVSGNQPVGGASPMRNQQRVRRITGPPRDR